MKRTLLSLAALSCVVTAIQAEKLETIEVVSVATKTQKSIDGVAATVTVVTQYDIEKMGAKSLKDVMANTPGINVQYGTFPSASSKSKSSLSIRGMSANGTLFLLDGRRLAGEVKNPYDLDRIPASIIERIEIVKGPMSSLYGADAVGGVINIITKRPSKDLQVDAGAQYGSNSEGDAQNLTLNLSLQGKNEGFGYSAYAGYTTTEPYTQSETENTWVPGGPLGKRPPSTTNPVTPPFPDMSAIDNSYTEDVSYREESEILTVGTRLEYAFTNDLVLGADINYFTEEREGNYLGYFHPSGYTFLGGPNVGKNIPVWNVPVESIDTNSRLDTSIDLIYAATDTLDLQARVYRSYYEKRNATAAMHYQDMGYASKSASEQNGMDADVDLQVAEISATYLPTEAHLLSVGAEYRDEKRNATVFDQSPSKSEKKVDYQSAYIQDEWEVTEKFNMILGARYDAISNADNKPTVRIGGMYSFDKLANLRANFAQGYRTPDIREMYIHKQTPNGLQIGADVMGYDLKPESTNAYEVALAGRGGGFHYELVLYYNEVKDMISQVMGTYNSTAAYTFENIANANTRGMELSLDYRVLENLSTNFFWTELRTENEDTGYNLEFQPRRTLMLSADYEPLTGLHAKIIAKYIGKQNYTQTHNIGAPNQTQTSELTNDFTLVDVILDYEINNTFEIYGGVNNIADEKVDDVLGSNVGTYYFAGARVHF